MPLHHSARRRVDWRWLTSLVVGTALVATYQQLNAAIDSPKPVKASHSIGWQSGQVAFQLPARVDSATLDEGEQEDITTRPSISKLNTTTYANIWSPWIYNPTPITDVFLMSCAFSPSIWSGCSPPTSPFEEISQGPWIRVDKDLNRKTGLWYLYLFERRRVNGSPLPVVSDIQFLSPEQAKSEEYSSTLRTEGWIMLEENLHSGVWGSQTLNLWYKRSQDASKGITELDVVYGKSGLRPGWSDVGKISTVKDEAAVKLQARRQPVPLPKVEDLRFNKAGNFTILQIADLHFSVGAGECRDIMNSTACPRNPDNADEATLAWLRPLFDEVKPDLVVLSGDQLNGQQTTFDAPSVIYKVASLFTNTTIPWTIIFGNHDSEATNVDRRNQMEIYQSLPYFIGQLGPDKVKGTGNYILPLYSGDGSKTNIFNLYFLDSHASFKPLFGKYDYETFDDTQIKWLKNASDSIQPILRPFQPADLSAEDSAFGLLDDLDLRSRKRRRTRKFRKRQQEPVDQDFMKPNAMAFWHIPVPEAYDEPDQSVNDTPLVVGTVDLEGNSAPSKNSGFFAKAILAQGESDAELTFSEVLPEIKVTVHVRVFSPLNTALKVKGHSHLRDACSRIKGVWMCFSGGSSYSGYGLRGFDRRVRVFELSDYGETVSTYKILDGSGKGDRESGVFDIAAAALAGATSLPDIGNSTTAYEKEVEELVDELAAQEDALKATEPEEAQAIEGMIEEIEEEYNTKEAGQSYRRQSRPVIDSTRGNSERILDFMVLVGENAMR